MSEAAERLPADGRRVLRHEPPNAEAGPAAFDGFLTPASQRFIRSNFPLPPVEGAVTLSLDGAVERPVVLDLDQLRGLGSRTVVVTTECAGNGRAFLDHPVPGEPWGVGALSTALWTGAPLRALLERAGLEPRAIELAFAGRDRGEVPEGRVVAFERSLPREKALHPDTLLAWEMNGAPIPPEFGGPLRLVVPGWYGMASVKWLSRIRALDTPFEGHFQTERYLYGEGRPVREMRLKSMLVEPHAGARLGREARRLRGYAWGGSGGIASVEIFADGVWRAAQLVGPEFPWAWRAFELRWEPAQSGPQRLRVRARDARGEEQPEVPEWNARGYGVNSIQSVDVEVE